MIFKYININVYFINASHNFLSTFSKMSKITVYIRQFLNSSLSLLIWMIYSLLSSSDSHRIFTGILMIFFTFLILPFFLIFYLFLYKQDYNLLHKIYYILLCHNIYFFFVSFFLFHYLYFLFY